MLGDELKTMKSTFKKSENRKRQETRRRDRLKLEPTCEYESKMTFFFRGTIPLKCLTRKFLAENPLHISEIENDLSEIEKPKIGSEPKDRIRDWKVTKISSLNLSTRQKKKISMVELSNTSHDHLHYYIAHRYVLVGAQKLGYHWDTFFKNSYRLRIKWVIDVVKRF